MGKSNAQHDHDHTNCDHTHDHTHDHADQDGGDMEEHDVEMGITEDGDVLIWTSAWNLCLRPSEARTFAKVLLELADEAEEA